MSFYGDMCCDELPDDYCMCGTLMEDCGGVDCGVDEQDD